MLTRQMLVDEHATLTARIATLQSEIDQLAGARQFCEFAMRLMDEPDQPAPEASQPAESEA